jgi:hypothetical protein
MKIKLFILILLFSNLSLAQKHEFLIDQNPISKEASTIFDFIEFDTVVYSSIGYLKKTLIGGVNYYAKHHSFSLSDKNLKNVNVESNSIQLTETLDNVKISENEFFRIGFKNKEENNYRKSGFVTRNKKFDKIENEYTIGTAKEDIILFDMGDSLRDVHFVVGTIDPVIDTLIRKDTLEDGLAILLDDDMNEIWKRRWGSPRHWDGFQACNDYSQDTLIALGSREKKYGTFFPFFPSIRENIHVDGAFIVFNNKGEVTDSLFFHNDTFELFGRRIQKLKDGNLVIVFQSRIVGFWGPYGFKTPIFIVKLTARGDIIWTKRLDKYYNTSTPNNLKALPDGGFVLCSSLNSLDPLSPPSEQVMRFDKDGNLKWREYVNFSDTRQEKIYSILPLKNGNFVFGGYVVIDSFGLAWAILADSNGCTIGNCLFTPGEEPVWTSEVLNIFPNPGQQIINIRWNSYTTGVVSIWDITGKKIYSEQLQNVSDWTFNNDYPPGSYIIRFINDEGIVFTGKWIRIE